MYAKENFKTKKSLKEAVQAGPVACFQPGPFGSVVADGQHCCEGPHYPEAHKWYATVKVWNMEIVKVIG